MAQITFAPGEREIDRTELSPSVLLFWIKTTLAVSSTRLVWDQANTLFGLIPLGHNEETTPLANTASVSVNTRFHIGRVVWGFVWFIVALMLFGNAWVLGVFFLLLAGANVANAMSATFVVTNNGGGRQVVQVSILEKAKLESFANKIKQHLFADQAALRHDQHMNVQQAQLYVQQAQLNAHLAQGSQPPAPGQRAPYPQQGQPPAPPYPPVPPQPAVPPQPPVQGPPAPPQPPQF